MLSILSKGKSQKGKTSKEQRKDALLTKKQINRIRMAELRPGERVTVPFVAGCGACPMCRSGNPQICDHQSQPGFTHWGSFAELVRIDYADVNLVPLPDEVDYVTVASLGCRFTTAFRALTAQGRANARFLGLLPYIG